MKNAYGIPNLELDRLVVDLNRSGAKLNPDCEVMLRSEPLVRELEEETGFSNACITVEVS